MKRFLYILNIIIAVLFFASCKDEDAFMPTDDEPCYTILVSVPDEADTRAYYKEDGSDISVVWEKGDVIYLDSYEFVFKEMNGNDALFFHYGSIDNADNWSGTVTFGSDPGSAMQLQKKNNECREHLEANVTDASPIDLNSRPTVDLLPADGKSLLHIQVKSPAMFVGGSTLKITGLKEEYTITLGVDPEHVFADEGEQIDIYVIVPAGETIAKGKTLSFLFKTNDGSEEYCYSMMCNASITAKNNEVVKMPLPTKPTRYLHIHGVAPVKILSGSMLKAKGLTANYDVSIQKDYAAGDPLDFYFALAKNDTIKNKMSLRFYLYVYDASTNKWETGDEYHYCEAQFEESQSNEVVIVDLGTPTHVAIQLGLPSGTKWATTNVGATSETGYGDYFAWGEIAPKTVFNNGSTSNYLLYNKSDVDLMNGGILSPKIIPYDKTQVPYDTLVAAYDAATQIWGNEWKMPSRTNLDELIAQTTRKGVTVNSVKGVSVTSKINSKSIFLPLAGYRDNEPIKGVINNDVMNSTKQGHYWTSSPKNANNNRTESYKCFVSEKDISGYEASSRYKGFSIRPVRVSN